MTQNEDEFYKSFNDWLINEKKIGSKVAYEYVRLSRQFMAKAKDLTGIDGINIEDKINDFLNIENPNSYRNNLAAIKKLFEFVGQPQLMQNFK